MNQSLPQAYFRLLEHVLAIGSMLIMSGALSIYLLEAEEQSSTTYQVIYASIYSVVMLLAIANYQALWKVVKANAMLCLLILLAVMSAAWSDHPAMTLQRGTALFGTSLLGIYLATRFSPEQFLRLLAWALGLAMIIALATAVVRPDLGMHDNLHHLGNWRGGFHHKNRLGRTAGLAVILFLLLILYRRKERLSALIMLVLSTFLLIMSNSRTAWLTTLAVLMLIPAFHLWRHRSGRLLTMLLITTGGTVVIALLMAGLDALLPALDRDVTLTGRTVLWGIAFEQGMEHPWLGSGYRAFWLGSLESANAVWQAVGWEAPHGHNSFLDLWLELGLLGVAMFTFVLIRCCRHTLMGLRQGGLIGLWFAAFLVAVNVSGIAERRFLQHNDLLWVMLVTTFVYTQWYAEKQQSLNPEPALGPASLQLPQPTLSH